MKCRKHGTLLFAFIYSMLTILQMKIRFNNIFQTLAEDPIVNLGIWDYLRILPVPIIAFSALLGIQILIDRLRTVQVNNEIDRRNQKTCKKLFWISSITSSTVGILFLLSCYPGTFTSDSWSTIYQCMGIWKITNHHTILFTVLLKVFIEIGKIIEDYNVCFFIFNVIQCLLIAFTVGYFISWLYKNNIPLSFCMLSAVYYISNPIIYTYSIMVQKDTLFSLSVFWLVLYLADIERSTCIKKRVFLFLLLFLVAFLRNNGLLVVWITMLFFILKHRTQMSKRFKITLFSVLTCFTIIQGPLYQQLQLQTGIVESLGVPLQQIAYVINTDGEINENDKAFLDGLLPLEKWKEYYRPFIVDPLKNSEMNQTLNFSQAVGLLDVWIKTLPANIGRYINAYLMQTYGFWSYGTHSSFGYADNSGPERGNNGMGIFRRDILKEMTGIDLTLVKKVIFPDAGSLFWLFLLTTYLSVYNNTHDRTSLQDRKNPRRNASMVSFVPVFSVWLSVMIATPVAFSLRYVFCLVLALPYYCIYPLLTNACIPQKNAQYPET